MTFVYGGERYEVSARLLRGENLSNVKIFIILKASGRLCPKGDATFTVYCWLNGYDNVLNDTIPDFVTITDNASRTK